MITKYRYIWIFFVAVAVRIILSFIFFQLFGWPRGSSVGFRIGLAESIMSGRGFSYNGIPNLYQLPVYPFYLALTLTILGNHWWSIALSQSLLDGFSCIGIAIIGNKVSKHGWLAGLIYSFYLYAAIEATGIIDTFLYIFIFVFTIYYQIRFVEENKLRYLNIASLLVGLGILNRPSFVIIFPVFFCWLFINMKRKWRLFVRYFFISTCLTALFPFLWLLRNYGLTGKFPVFSVGGQHFMWYAHNEHTYEVYKRNESPDKIGLDPRYPMNPNIKVSDFFKITPLSQIKLGKLCSEKSIAWIRNNKLEVLKYSLLKLKVFLLWEYFPANADQPYQSLRLWIYRLSNGPVLILGWLGLFLLFFIREKYSLYFLGIAFGFISIHVYAMSTSRHKIPLDAFLMIFVPFGVNCLYEALVNLKNKIGKK